MMFPEAFELLMTIEGEYSDHPKDPGGKTRWGITQKVALRHGYTGDMMYYPVDKAKEIYRTDYWDAVRADELPPLLRYPVFDAAVNSGVTRSIEWLQEQVGVADIDGVLGPITMKAAWAADPRTVSAKLIADRLYWLTNLPTWGAFGRGWARRMVTLLRLVSEG